MSKKNALFTIEQHITFRDYLTYCRKIGKDGRRKQQKMDMFLSLLMFIGALIGYCLNISIILIFGMTGGVLFFFMSLFMWMFDALRQYRLNKMISKDTRKITFYDDSFSVKWHDEKGDCKYDRLAFIAEDENAFYLMVNNGSGEIVLKRSCSPDLIVFLQEKSKQKACK